jgi:DNA-binding FadR family transcriptional regulator
MQKNRFTATDGSLIERLRAFIADQPEDENRLPPERELALRLGVGRKALRKALDALEAEGCLYRHVGRGTFVRGRASVSVPPLSRIFETTNPLDVMEVRLILEPRAARLAAMRISGAELAEIDRTIERGEASQDTQAFESWDGRFHQQVASASRNELLSALLAIVQATRDSQVWGNVKQRTVTRESRERYTSEHRVIARALRMRDAAEAEEAMARHLAGVAREIHAALGHAADRDAP